MVGRKGQLVGKLSLVGQVLLNASVGFLVGCEDVAAFQYQFAVSLQLSVIIFPVVLPDDEFRTRHILVGKRDVKRAVSNDIFACGIECDASMKHVVLDLPKVVQQFRTFILHLSYPDKFQQLVLLGYFGFFAVVVVHLFFQKVCIS